MHPAGDAVSEYSVAVSPTDIPSPRSSFASVRGDPVESGSSRRASFLYDSSGASGANYLGEPPPSDYEGDRRGSGDSSATLHEDNKEDFSAFSFSSYKHPYDIAPPAGAHGHAPQESSLRSRTTEASKAVEKYSPDPQSMDIEKAMDETTRQLPRRRRGYLTNLIDLYNAYDDPEGRDPMTERRNAIANATKRTPGLGDPLAYNDEQVLDPDDPLLTGVHKESQEDPEDLEKNALRAMNYKDRRKEQEKIRIEFNVSCT